jgi:LL-diaminopimelate aminotransferase
MALINEHYLKLQRGYLFPEIARRVEAFREASPEKGKRVIACGIGDVTEPLPAAVRDAMHAAVDELGHRGTFRGYGEACGYDFLREAIVACDFKSHGLDVDADEIFVSDGSKTDCSAVLDVLGRDNRIGITDPVYPAYVDGNVMVGNTGPATDDAGYEGLIYLACTADNGFLPEIPAEPLDIVYLCYPNNPTGAMITRPQLEAWIEYANRHDAIIMYDVAYQAFVGGGGGGGDAPRSIYEIDGAKRCAIEFHSFSKNAGFTGVRCGYTVVPKELEGRTASGEKVALHGLWTRRWNTKSNGVSYPVQRGAEATYSDAGRQQIGALVEHYMTNARLLKEGCESMGLRVWGGTHSPYVWVACPDGLSSWQTFDLALEEAQVVVTPGVGFGRCGEGYFRISAFNSRENVTEAVSRLQSIRAAAGS